jgi:hypothetical protein
LTAFTSTAQRLSPAVCPVHLVSRFVSHQLASALPKQSDTVNIAGFDHFLKLQRKLLHLLELSIIHLVVERLGWVHDTQAIALCPLIMPHAGRHQRDASSSHA